MNRFVSMEEARRLLGLEGRSTRWVKRRLAQIAEARSATSTFQLVRLVDRPNAGWFTTEADLRRLLPELFAHEASDAEELRDRVERQATELEGLRRRIARLENQRVS